MLTIQNCSTATVQAKTIYHYRSKVQPDLLIDIDTQTCKDVPDAVGAELLVEFPFLRVVGHSQDQKVDVVSPDAVSSQIVQDGFQKADNTPDMISQMNQALPVVCNMCGQKCKNLKGRAVHLRTAHKE